MAHTTRPGDIADFCLKEHDCERLDSGIDSYQSFDSRSSSFQTSDVNNISSQFSNVRISKPTVDDPTNDIDKAGQSADEWCDSGVCVSFEESTHSIHNSLSSEPQKLAVEQSPVAEALLQCFIPDKDGDTYLHLAIVQKRIDISFNIIQMCTVPELLDIANNEQQTALHLAVLTDQPKLTRCLVAYGANVRCKDKYGNTPLHVACELGLVAQVDMLTSKLDALEDPGLQSFSLPQNVNERNYLGLTPLHLAVCNNQLRVVQILINVLKCDVNVPDLTSGRTPLHHAVERRNMEAVKILMSARANVNALTYDECSPLHLAAARGCKLGASSLLKYGADLFLITRDDNDVFELSEHNPRLHKMLRDVERKHREGRFGFQPSVVG